MPQVGAFFAAIGSAVTSVGAAFAASQIGTFLTTTFLGKLLTTVALTALQVALQPKPKKPGIVTDFTISGATNPQGFVVGRYATAGSFIAPPMTHGNAGKTPNAFLTYVIALGDIRGQSLAYMYIDGQSVAINGAVHGSYGTSVNSGGPYAGNCWVKYYDGSQTAADPYLLSVYGSHPTTPWQSDMIGRDLCYAIITFKFNANLYSSLPTLKFVMDGIPLYDPRADNTVGGSGSQRWNDKTTWATTSNPKVIGYNIHRGITLADGSVWGGKSADYKLPLANWFAAMNACDGLVSLPGGGVEPAYRSGFEIFVDQEPADILQEFDKTCSGNTVNDGIYWRTRVGAPSAAIYSFTDDDVIATNQAVFTSFGGVESTYNGIHARFPDPASDWEPVEAPARYNATYEAEDQGKRLIADLTLSAVPYPNQVQRLMYSYIEEERRFRKHSFHLPPDAAKVDVLDATAWTSNINGYSNKIFEVTQKIVNFKTMVSQYTFQEKDPTDYDWDPVSTLPYTPTPNTNIFPQPVLIPSWSVSPHTITDSATLDRRPAIRVAWDSTDIVNVQFVETQVKVKTTGVVIVASSIAQLLNNEDIISQGILPDELYQVRSRLVEDNTAPAWTTWTDVISPAIYPTNDDFQGGIVQFFKDNGGNIIAYGNVLPSKTDPARYDGELFTLTAPPASPKLYRFDVTIGDWTASVPTTDLSGLIGSSLIANGAVGAKALAIGDFSNLLQDPSFEAGVGWTSSTDMVYDTVDYRNGLKCFSRTYFSGIAANGNAKNDLLVDCAQGDTFFISVWLKKITGAACTSAGVGIVWRDNADAIISTSNVLLSNASITTSYQLVSGQVTAPAGCIKMQLQITVIGHTAGKFVFDDAYVNRANAGQLLVDGTITGSKLVAGTITGDRIVANTITGSLLAVSGIITAAAQIQDAVITGAKIGNLQVDTLQIADNAVTLPFGITFSNVASGTFSFTADDDMTVAIIITAYDVTLPAGGIEFKLSTNTSPISVVWAATYEKGYGTNPRVTTTAIAIKVLSAGTTNLRLDCVNATTFAGVSPVSMDCMIIGLKK